MQLGVAVVRILTSARSREGIIRCSNRRMSVRCAKPSSPPLMTGVANVLLLIASWLGQGEFLSKKWQHEKDQRERNPCTCRAGCDVNQSGPSARDPSLRNLQY